MKRVLFLTFFTIFAISSCTKENNNEPGLIRYLGDPAVDGCGWAIEIDSTIYKPQNLATEFEKDNLDVRVKYNVLTSRYDCGDTQDVYAEIYIYDIEER